MSFDLLGLVVLFVSLLVAVVIQAGLALAAMYAMHRYFPDHLPEKTYHQFDFDTFQMTAFTEMLTRLITIFLGPTLVLHLFVFVFVGFSGVRRHYLLVGFSLFVLEVAAIAAGLYFLLRLDRVRLSILTALSAVVYLLLLTLFLYRKLS
jgi:hypothetical protein